MSGKMHITTFLQQQLELDQGKYISDSFFRVVLLAILHQKAQGGAWVTPEGTCRMDPGDQERGRVTPGILRDHRDCWGTKADTPGGLEVDDLQESLPIQTVF